MLYLFWALLNIGLFIFFVSISFKIAKYIKARLGLLTSIIFVFGLLSFVTLSNSDDHEKRQNLKHTQTWDLRTSDNVDNVYHYIADVDLEKTVMSKYSLSIGFDKDSASSTSFPVSAYTLLTGFQSGTNWKPVSIIVNKRDDGQSFEYEVDGIVGWMLLGSTIYYQPKHWKGVVVLK